MRNTWENENPSSGENIKNSFYVAGWVDWLPELERAELGSWRSAWFHAGRTLQLGFHVLQYIVQIMSSVLLKW